MTMLKTAARETKVGVVATRKALRLPSRNTQTLIKLVAKYEQILL